MDRMALDALNRGWALGFGTRVRVVNEDFEAAYERHAEAERPGERPARSRVLLALLLALGPMPRAVH